MSMSKESQLEYMRRQFRISEKRADYWHALATTGAGKRRNLQQGREATAEETARGLCMGWRDLTDEEKVEDALKVMGRHIDRMNELAESIASLESEEQT